MDSFFNSFANKDSRPTLPSLRSLNLPIPRTSPWRAGAASTNDLPPNDLNGSTYPTDDASNWGKTSSSSTAPTSSFSPFDYRTPSPIPSSTSSSSTSPSLSSPTRATRSFRLVPCEIEDAEAVVVVTESTEGGSSREKAMLLVGPAASPYRQPSTRPVGKNSRVHPYKLAPSQNLNRRSSMLSINSRLNR